MNIMKQQIKNLFNNHQQTMMDGLWFSGHEREGEYKEWWENSQLYVHCFYKDDVEEGEYKKWWKNGQLIRHYFYKGGEYDGEYKSWHSNGELYKHCFYKDKEYTINKAKELFPDGPWL